MNYPDEPLHFPHFDLIYSDILRDLLNTGEKQSNRTGIDTVYKIGCYFELNQIEYQFPLLTTKKVYWKSAFAEMLGFILGFDSAEQFRALGCNVWNQNANENKEWLANPNRKGIDDLGSIYGVQWRKWINIDGDVFDQLSKVVDDLSKGIDNRREIVTAWNPGELSQMALPPCHMTMIFSLVKGATELDLFLLVRSNDVFLGMPFNVAQYAFLLMLIAQITNKKVGAFRYYANNYHLYVNHLVAARIQSLRMPLKTKSKVVLNPGICSLEDLSRPDLILDDLVEVQNYLHHPPIRAAMAV